MKIGIGNDHAGYDLKLELVKFLQEKGCEIEDFGAFSSESVDYPDFAHAVCKSIEEGQNDLGILVCGSGNGINMAANKHRAIRSALCWEEELAALARQHNNANVLALPARFIKEEKAIAIANSFLENSFEGGRHEKRVNKIACI